MAIPACFGQLEKVFPMGPGGLRASPPSCFECECKTECLRAALAGAQGAPVHEERVDRAYESGGMGFLERWSRRKTLNRLKKKTR